MAWAEVTKFFIWVCGLLMIWLNLSENQLRENALAIKAEILLWNAMEQKIVAESAARRATPKEKSARKRI